jgi:hypothetical protein
LNFCLTPSVPAESVPAESVPAESVPSESVALLPSVLPFLRSNRRNLPFPFPFRPEGKKEPFPYGKGREGKGEQATVRPEEKEGGFLRRASDRSSRREGGRVLPSEGTFPKGGFVLRSNRRNLSLSLREGKGRFLRLLRRKGREGSFGCYAGRKEGRTLRSRALSI